MGLCQFLLFDLFQVFSASAFARRLTDRVAFAPGAARTDIFAHHRECGFLSLDINIGLVAFNFSDFGFHQVAAASTFAGAPGDGEALAALTTATNIDLIPHLEIDRQPLGPQPSALTY